MPLLHAMFRALFCQSTGLFPSLVIAGLLFVLRNLPAMMSTSDAPSSRTMTATRAGDPAISACADTDM